MLYFLFCLSIMNFTQYLEKHAKVQWWCILSLQWCFNRSLTIYLFQSQLHWMGRGNLQMLFFKKRKPLWPQEGNSLGIKVVFQEYKSVPETRKKFLVCPALCVLYEQQKGEKMHMLLYQYFCLESYIHFYHSVKHRCVGQRAQEDLQQTQHTCIL